MKTKLAALLAGTLFGLGLAISQMINPQKVLAFLDIFGNWDPSLAFVLGGAVAVSFVGFRIAGQRQAPFLATRFHAPTRTDLDRRLLLGAGIFGIGWGLAGYCPGPAISALALGTFEPVIFLAAMAAGSVAVHLLESRRG
jgi:uncharacterized protein